MSKTVEETVLGALSAPGAREKYGSLKELVEEFDLAPLEVIRAVHGLQDRGALPQREKAAEEPKEVPKPGLKRAAAR